MKYETESFFGHKSYGEFLVENTDIAIYFVNVIPDNDSMVIVVTFRRIEK